MQFLFLVWTIVVSVVVPSCATQQKCTYDATLQTNKKKSVQFSGYQASLSSHNRSLVEKSGVARALVEVSQNSFTSFLTS